MVEATPVTLSSNMALAEVATALSNARRNGGRVDLEALDEKVGLVLRGLLADPTVRRSLIEQAAVTSSRARQMLELPTRGTTFPGPADLIADLQKLQSLLAMLMHAPEAVN